MVNVTAEIPRSRAVFELHTRSVDAREHGKCARKSGAPYGYLCGITQSTSHTIAFERVEARHTADNIRRTLEDIIKSLGSERLMSHQ